MCFKIDPVDRERHRLKNGTRKRKTTEVFKEKTNEKEKNACYPFFLNYVKILFCCFLKYNLQSTELK